MKKAIVWKIKFLILTAFIVVSSIDFVAAIDNSKWSIQVVIADDNNETRKIVSQLEKRLPSIQTVEAQKLQTIKRRSTILIAIGPSALRALINNNVNATIISLFVPRQLFQEITKANDGRSGVTGIYAEPSPNDQLKLASAIYRPGTTIGLLSHDINAPIIKIAATAASQLNLKLTVEAVNEEQSLNRALNKLASASAVALLLVPDSTIVNAETIKNILITTYRHNQGVIGYSSSLVKAGALAAPFSTTEDTVVQLEELINEFEMSGNLPSPQYPKYFSVSFNENVARSLNLLIDPSVKSLSRKKDNQ